MNFGEKKSEFSPKHGKEVPVWQSPKYLESRAKAEEIIKIGKYNVQESDFWILMNVTKSEKMAYTGLIISHNGCLKINDCLESKFDPSCVTIDKEGYKGSLVYTYCNKEQGIYEVGEVSASNCKNEYPYAMAYKRLFDRVVLKLSKLAYAGIYSDSEADEFARRLEVDPDKKVEKQESPQQEGAVRGQTPGGYGYSANPPAPVCSECGCEITANVHDYSIKQYKRPLCMSCQKKLVSRK